MYTHIVTRKFTIAGGVELSYGTQIDASDWPNVDLLVNTNFLRPLNAKEIGLDLPSSIFAGSNVEPKRRGRPRKLEATPA